MKADFLYPKFLPFSGEFLEQVKNGSCCFFAGILRKARKRENFLEINEELTII